MIKISKNPILKVENFSLTYEETFNKVLSNFVATPTAVFNLLETVILSCVLVEAIVKDQLKKINPTLVLDKIDAETIALVSRKERKLLVKPTNDISDIRTANITVLIERLSKFCDFSKCQNGLLDFFKLRNKIVHSADNVELQESQISILLTKYVFPFIKVYIDVNQQTWQDIQKITLVAHDRYRRNLVKIIVEHRRLATKIKPEEVVKLIDSNPRLDLEKEEYPRQSDLTCPGCHNPSMSLVDGVDFDYDDGEVTPHGYLFALCRVCDLKLDNVDLDEIIQNPEYYFSPTDEQLVEWIRALQEPDYSEIDY